MIRNIINNKLVESDEYRELMGWKLPVTTSRNLSFALKVIRKDKPHPLRERLQALIDVGKEAAWINEDHFTEIIERTGSSRRFLRESIGRINHWLASLDQYVSTHGRVHETCLRSGDVLWKGGLPTSLVLAGDASALAPNALTHCVLATSNLIVKGSSVEPLSTFLFCRALLDKGIDAPNLLYFDSSDETDRSRIRDMIARTDQSIVYGADNTVKSIYTPLGSMPEHKIVAFWTGRSAAMVLPDADMETAVRGALIGVGEDRGDRCICTKKVFVPESRREEFEKELKLQADSLERGDPQDPSTYFGRVDPATREMAESRLGASEVIYDNHVVFARCTDDAALMHEEIPYPIAGVRYYSDDEDPVSIANRLVHGTESGRMLVLSVFTESDTAFAKVAVGANAHKIIRNRQSTYIDHTTPHQSLHLFKELMRTSRLVDTSVSDVEDRNESEQKQ